MKTALNFYGAAKKTLSIIEQKEREKALPPNIDKDLLLKSINNHTCAICQQQLYDKEKSIIQHLIDSFRVSSKTSNILMSIRSELSRIVNEAESYEKNKNKLMAVYNDVEKQLSEIDANFDNIEKVLNRISDKEEIKRRYKERQEHEDLLKANTEKLGAAKTALQNAELQKDNLNKSHKKEREKEIECFRINELIDFATTARDIINEIESEMMDEVRKKMEKSTTDYFLSLIWKKDTYDYIKLDNDFQLDLFHKDGYSCVGTCGAAERCLLALSFTLALHEVSGFKSLLFIDTPVARVSDVNRKNFAKVLCDASKRKQIIMTFTPDEYSPEIKNIFDPVVRSKTELIMNYEKITSIGKDIQWQID